ncbi:hypothetical protein J3A83DRAFT_4047114, partial [Scleroderma citrinum]
LTIQWVPGHTNIEGNKSVDKEAKKATECDLSAMKHLPAPLQKLGILATLPYSKATLLQSFNTKL